jgi:hypothetical protein
MRQALRNVYVDWRQRSLLEVNADWRQRTFHQQPAAIPQQLEPTRSMAKGSNIYSHEIVDIRLPWRNRSEASGEVFAVAEQSDLIGRLHAERDSRRT